MERFLSILSSISEAVWFINLRSQKCIFLNEQLAKLFETDASHIRQEPSFWQSHIHAADAREVKRQLESISPSNPITCCFRAIIHDRIKWLVLKQQIVFDKELQADVLISIIRDETKVRKRSSGRQKAFRYFFLHNPNPLWIYDRDTFAFLEVNNAAVSKYGYSREEFLRMTIADIRPEEDIALLTEQVKKVSNKYSSSDKIWRHTRKDGGLIYAAISGHGIHYMGRKAEIVMAHDITREVETRQKISLAKQNLDAFVNNIEDHIWSVDTNYHVLMANTAMKEMLKGAIGREPEIGKSIFMPEFDPQACSVWRKYYDRALSGETFTITELISLAESPPFFAETRLSPIRLEDAVVGVACISSNIQERIEHQEKMIEHNRRLLELISIASHEIRGPVASILGLTNLFNTEDYTDPFNAEIVQFVQTITQQLDGMIHTLVEKTYALKREEEATDVAQQSQSENG